MGLVESEAKTSYCPGSTSPPGLPPKHEARLRAAGAVLSVLGNLCLCFEHFHSFARIFGISKGLLWLVSLAHLPTQKVCWSQWTALRTEQRILTRANKHIGAIPFGGTSHLDCLAAGNLLRCVRQLKEVGRLRWHNRGGSPLHTLRRWLQERGWTEVSPWKWRGVMPECSLDLQALSQSVARSHLCCWPGCNELGTWKHMAWICRYRPAHAKRLRVRDFSPIQFRLG